MEIETTQCTEAVLKLSADSLALVFTIMGAEGEADDIAEAAVKNINAEGIADITKLAGQLASASKITSKAVIIFKIFQAVIDNIGKDNLWDAIKHALKWYQWAILGVQLLAQILLLVVTDGAAEIAEIALDTVAVATIVSDSIAVGDCC